MLKALIAPYLGWVYGALAVAIVGAGIYAYNTIYDRGYSAAAVVYEKQAEDQLKANNFAIASAEKGLREDVAALILDKEKLEDEVARLNSEAGADPSAHAGGIKRSSVQRVNSIR
jgi:hypothetical protein